LRQQGPAGHRKPLPDQAVAAGHESASERWIYDPYFEHCIEPDSEAALHTGMMCANCRP
jgi:hypothetical protein